LTFFSLTCVSAFPDCFPYFSIPSGLPRQTWKVVVRLLLPFFTFLPVLAQARIVPKIFFFCAFPVLLNGYPHQVVDFLASSLSSYLFRRAAPLFENPNPRISTSVLIGGGILGLPPLYARSRLSEVPSQIIFKPSFLDEGRLLPRTPISQPSKNKNRCALACQRTMSLS